MTDYSAGKIRHRNPAMSAIWQVLDEERGLTRKTRDGLAAWLQENGYPDWAEEVRQIRCKNDDSQ